MEQVKNSFDAITKQKIIKGFLYGLVSAVAAGAVSYIQTGQIKVSVAVSISAFSSSVLNVPIDYVKGQERNI